ncbi:hypothetical protein [Cytobacillus kochii]|uniref:hypothetical protein n=1 Tax=Cytobacillus kochii TaxID=859143 RepID=UPI00203B4A63|nr:hypothetical protein [Cytobacillus kochii]MCM3323297.1 hypothetical protein [Cytobacillus kochii]MCM3345692.1 hypothetical protein [Cytobacillus kochii]
MNNRRTPGARPKEYSEEIIREIIYRYRQQVQPTGRIPNEKVYKFAKNLVNSEIHDTNDILNNLDKKYGSEDFWRKNNKKTGKPNLGKKLVDEANELKNYYIKDSVNNTTKIPSVEDAVYKLNDKEDLIEALKPLEDLCIKLAEKEVKLSEEIDKLKEKLTYHKNKSERQEDAIFKLARYGRTNKGLVNNILNTGSSKSKLVSEALESIFINPMEFLYDNKKTDNEIEEPSTVVDFSERKKAITETYSL